MKRIYHRRLLAGITDGFKIFPDYVYAYNTDEDEAKPIGVAFFWLVFEIEFMWAAPCHTHAAYEDEMD